MKHATSESDVTSLATTSPPLTPKTPKRPAAYYVQSPSRDSQSSTAHTTPVYNNSPLDSPARHSRIFPRSPSSPGRKRPNSGKEWRAIVDEDEDEADKKADELPKLCVAAAFWLSVVLVLVFTMVCLVVWGAARQYRPSVIVKSLTVHDLYVGEGTDRTGVTTKLITLNCSLHINVHNPSTLFGIHVSSSSSRLMYSEISIADGQLDKFYQPRTSHRLASLVLHGEKTPLYGAGATLDLPNTVPLTLELTLTTRGYVIGKLVRVSHAKHVKCVLVIDSGTSSNLVRFTHSACSRRHNQKRKKHKKDKKTDRGH